MDGLGTAAMTILGYGRYGDDPQHVGCPRAKSDMTPCIARDGHLALAGEPFGGRRDCVGCYAKPADLLAELETANQAGERVIYAGNPASGRDLDDDDHRADHLTRLVRELTEHMAR